MLQVLIADDEYKVCQLIEQLGEWEQLGLEIAAVCHDGEEALQAIEAKKPDIVITDIRMPVYDGLELIKRTKELGIDAEFIVISGYRQFEYAYGAIQYGVSDYLLKPIDKSQLNMALTKICETYHARKEIETSGEQLERLKTERMVWEERQFMTCLMEGRFDPAKLEEYRLQFHVSLEETLIYQAMFLNTSSPKLHQPASGFGEKAVETARQQLFMVSYFAALCTPDGILFLAGCKPEVCPMVAQAVSRVFSGIRALRDFYGDFDLVIARGHRVEGPAGLARTTAEALRNERTKLTMGWNQMLDPCSGAGEKPGEEKGWARPDRFKALENALDCFFTKEAGEWFDQWLDFFKKQDNASVEDLLDSRDGVLKRLEFCCLEDRLHEIRRQTDRARNGRDLILQMKNAVLSIMEEYLEAKEQEETRPIRLARDYILKHYASPLTLEEVAGAAGFSAVYFSTMFKKLSGQSFADYLTEVRITEAKRLLKEETMSILEISGAVGYGDNKYFRKLFKKMTGMKPSDYRKLYQ